MRSRYTAYTMNNLDYIEATMRGPALALFNKKATQYPSTQWLGLEVLKSYMDPKNPTVGYVEFIAHYKDNGMENQIHELSEFHLEDGHWYYVDAINS